MRSDEATASRSSGGLQAAPISVVLAGGGTAGHVEPAMAVACQATVAPSCRVVNPSVFKRARSRLLRRTEAIKLRASAAMALSSTSVLMNSLRLRGYTPVLPRIRPISRPLAR